jgi:hypothetical protein
LQISKSLRVLFASTLTLGLCLGAGQAQAVNSAGSITSYVDAPSVQNSYVAGTLMNFDNLSGSCPLVWPGIGTTDLACIAKTPDAYGGASTELSVPTTGGTGTGYGWVENFKMTLTLDEPATYFGLWWSAGNEANYIDFYNDDELLGSFSCATLVAALTEQELATTNGASYATSEYFGSPVTGTANTEPYAYLHIFAGKGKTFNKIALSGAGFEFDNVVVGRGANSAAASLVHLEGDIEPVVVEPIDTQPRTPELANTGTNLDPWLISFFALALLSAGAGIMLLTANRRASR